MSDTAKKRILLVEDEALIALSERLALETRGYEVVVASNGEAAVALARERRDLDLVLMDIDLGRGMDGTEAARIILAERELPLVFLSSHTEPEIVERTESISSYGYIVKNSGFTILEASVKMAFKLFEARRKESAHEAALLESLGRARDIVNGIPSGFFTYRFEAPDRLVLEDANPEAERMTGISAERSRGRDFDALWPEARKLGLTGRYLEALRTGVPYETESLAYADDRLAGAYRIRAFRLPRDRLAVAFEDVTERRRAERELARREALYRGLYESMADGVFLQARDGRLLEANEACLELFGLSREELLARRGGEARWDVVREDGSSFPGEEHPSMRAFAEGRPVRGVVAGIKNPRLGRYVWTSISAVPHVEPGEEEPSLVFVTLHDISARIEAAAERRAADAEHRRLASRLAEAQRVAGIGSWEWDLVSNEIWWSEETYRIFGVTPESFRPSFEANGGFIHPEDAADYAASFRRCIESREPLRYEVRLLLRDGTIKHCLGQGEVDYASDGSPRRFIGTILDQSDRIRAAREIERQLAEKELLLKEVHHRIKNHLNSVISLLELQARGAPESSAGVGLLEAAGRIAGIRAIYDRLLQGSSYRELPAKRYLEELAASILAAYPSPVPVALDLEIEELSLGPKELLPLGIIVNELMTNSLKYAFKGRAGGRIGLRLAGAGGGLVLELRDDGIGLPEGYDPLKASSLGLSLVRMLAEQLGAAFSFSGEGGGTRCLLSLPLVASAPRG